MKHLLDMHWDKSIASPSSDTVEVLESEAGETDMVEPGELAQVFDVFPESGSAACSCCETWIVSKQCIKNSGLVSKKYPEAHAIVLGRNLMGTDTWLVQSVWIHNKRIRACLKKILSDYPGAEFTDEVVKFERPFPSLVHRWGKIKQALADERNDETRKLLQLFMDTMEKNIGECFRSWDQFQATGRLAHQNLALAFVPNDTVVRVENGVVSCGTLLSTKKVHNTPFHDYICQLTVAQYVWDGSAKDCRITHWNIDGYRDTMPVSGLWLSPLKYRGDGQAIVNQMLERGNKYDGLRDQHYRFYKGGARALTRTQRDGLDRPMNRQIAERVIVHTRGYYEVEEAPMPELHPLRCLTNMEEALTRSTRTPPIKGFNPRGYEHRYRVGVEDSSSDKKPANREPITDEECVVAVSRVVGFGIESKEWFELEVDNLHPVDWNTAIFDKLVMKKTEKGLLQMAISNHMSNTAANPDDIFSRKGSGLVVLLCGPPGTGKTFTAEAVAENLKCPLYRVGAGDLQVADEDIDSRLKITLQRCALFKGVLLIDEADVFLETRSSDNLPRNALVSTFLRMLEYYPGVIFLTTNRVLDIDPAFESRIDLALAFPDLDEAARAKVWRNFLEVNDGSCDLDEDSIALLSAVPLNGRHIQSAVKMAKSLVASESKDLTVEHLRTLVDMRNKTSKAMSSGSVA